MRLWVDTDVGTDPDDAVALLCAAAQPDVELVGVSTVDDPDGERARLAGELVDSRVVTGGELALEDLRAADADAVLAIGPLTNVARWLHGGYDPPRLTVMGGARRPVRHRGALRSVEHNFASDPGAAAAVLGARDRVLICPLDVTARMRLTESERRQLVDTAPSLGVMFDTWIAWQREAGVPDEEAVVCLHDPLALVALMGHQAVRVERAHLSVGPAGELQDDADGRSHDVVVGVDVTAVKAWILALLATTRR